MPTVRTPEAPCCHSPSRGARCCLPPWEMGSAPPTTIDFGAIFPFTCVPAYSFPVYASQRPLPNATQDSVRGCWLGLAAVAISGACASRAFKAQRPQIRTCPIQASGSSVYGFATRRSSRRRAPVGPLSSVVSLRWVHGSMSVASVPPEVPYTDLRLPSTGSPGVGSPASRVLCRGSDVSAPRVASLPSLGGSILTPLSSLPARMGVTRPGPGPFL